MPDELTDEQLDAYRDVASTFSPGMRELYAQPEVAAVGAPPVPLPLGTNRGFASARSAPVQADPLEEIRKQINRVDFETKKAAVEAATRFEALRAYQNDLAAGKDPTRWLPILFEKHPAAIAPQMRERRLGAPPQFFPATSNMPAGAAYGGSFRFAPASSGPPPTEVKTIPIVRPDGSVDEENYAVPSASGRGVTIHPAKPKVTAPSASARQKYYRDQIGDIDIALKKLTFAEPPPADAEKQRTDLQNKKQSFQKELDELFKPSGKAGSTAPTETKPSVAPKNQADVAAIIKQANEAIAKGKDPVAIRKRLKEMGIEVKE